MKVCFATNNKHKLEEVKQILGDRFELYTLAAAGFEGEIPETHETIEENSLEKAAYIFPLVNMPVFSDDSGLEIEALEGRPGVHSAHYAGTRDALANIQKVMAELGDQRNRKAQFKTVITYFDGQRTEQFEGVVEGVITEELSGHEGFGYDPIFKPDGFDQTFAEMMPELKNQISHRKRAAEKLSDFLNTLNK
jgi:XTP/dITP diphosphohydrolase